MITKRNGHGQTECRGCKDKGKFALTWDSWLYNFNNEPYCFECLMEKLEELQQRIDKAIKYLEQPYRDNFDYSKAKLLEILKGAE